MSQAIETDRMLAGLYVRQQAAEAKLALIRADMLRMAGAKFFYRGRSRVTEMTIREARGILIGELERLRGDEYGYAKLETGNYGGGSNIGQVRRAFEKEGELLMELAEIEKIREPFEALFEQERWSRFFLVTSSQGHIHSSMSCGTCRPTTTFGWLPELSGSTEAEAVEQQGPALCTVCFPSAPLEWTAEKISKAAAARAAV